MGRAGELVSLYEFGADEMGYLSLPETQPQGSILLIPDALGPRGVVKQRCDLLAKLGYVTLAVDLYNGSASETPETADRLQQKLESEVAILAIQAGMKLLSGSPRYRTKTVILASWGDNFKFTMTAANALESFTPNAISWVDPDGLEGLDIVKGSRVPLQLILRRESIAETYQAGLTRFNQLRGMDCEVSIIEQQRGFLLNPKSTPEGVKAWTALINFWQDVIDGNYSPQVVSGTEVMSDSASVPDEKPRSIVTRPRIKHPRLN